MLVFFFFSFSKALQILFIERQVHSLKKEKRKVFVRGSFARSH